MVLETALLISLKSLQILSKYLLVVNLNGSSIKPLFIKVSYSYETIKHPIYHFVQIKFDIMVLRSVFEGRSSGTEIQTNQIKGVPIIINCTMFC